MNINTFPQQKSVQRVLSMLAVHSAIGYQKIRLGNNWDGGYVILDDFSVDSCCLSIGIGGNVSFDLALATRGYVVFQFDHTIADPPIMHERFVFVPVGLGQIDRETDTMSLATMVTAFDVQAFSSRILKIDIEGAEWDALIDVSSDLFDLFDQIVIEFHFFCGLENVEFLRKVENVFHRITRTHAPIHVHGNNGADYCLVHGVPVPRVIEVSFIRKRSFKTNNSYELLPGPLDFSNNHLKPDYYLGSFLFPDYSDNRV